MSGLRYADVGPAMATLQSLPCSRLELHFKCEGLRDKDWTSKSDPVLLMYTRRPPATQWTFIGSTEKVMNTLSPTFTKAIECDYFFEEVTQVRFEVLDVDSEVNGIFRGDSLGSLETTVAELVTARPNFQKRLVLANFPGSTLTVVVEQVTHVGGFVDLQLSGKKLANKDGLFGKSDPFFVISKGREDGMWVNVARSEYINNDLNPKWKTQRIKTALLCNGDFNRPLKIDVFDYDRDDSVDCIGSLQTTLHAILSTPGWTAPLKDPKGKKKEVGSIVAGLAQLVQQPTFLNYIQGGLEVGLFVAIDFTASNGNPQDPRSLHYNSPDPNHQNQYETAIRATADVLLPYDRDGLVPAYGYGGQMPQTGMTSHCFALNGNPAAPSVQGVQGVLAAYNQALRSIPLSGPTCFAPIIRAVAQADIAPSLRSSPPPLRVRLRTAPAASVPTAPQQFRYSVLLIVTDGEIMDMDETVDALVTVSTLALSVVIVGVGPGPFGQMQQLDGDAIALKGRSGAAKRDIVQFVKMSDYSGLASGARLAKDVLHELPDQVVSFFMSQNRPPPAPLQQAPPRG